jgi:hypothetical protein
MAQADRTFTVHQGGDITEQAEAIAEAIYDSVIGNPVADPQTGEVVGRKILRWVEVPAHLDTGRWKRANGGLEIVVPAECDDSVVTTITAAVRVQMEGTLLGDASIEGGSWRRDPDDPELIVYKFNLRFAAVEGPLVLARLAGLARRDELRGMLRLGVRHQQLGLDLPDGREVSLTARADEEEEDRVDDSEARDVTPDHLDNGEASGPTVAE